MIKGKRMKQKKWKEKKQENQKLVLSPDVG